MFADDMARSLAASPVVPILTVATPQQAVLAGEALHRGGMSTLEITLRTPQSLAAIRAVKEALPRCRWRLELCWMRVRWMLQCRLAATSVSVRG